MATLPKYKYQHTVARRRALYLHREYQIPQRWTDLIEANFPRADNMTGLLQTETEMKQIQLSDIISVYQEAGETLVMQSKMLT